MLKRTGSADITIRDDRVLVPVTINGHRASLVLGTGGAGTVISSEYVEPFGLKQDHHLAVASWALRDWGRAMVIEPNSMTIGSQGFRTPRIIAAPNSRPAIVDDPPVIGWLGMDLLTIEDFEIDFANRKLNFYSTDHCPGEVVYWTDQYSSARIVRGSGVSYFPMELEGQKIMAILSTGTPVTTLGTDVTRKLFGFDESSPNIDTETDASGHTTSHYRAMALTGSGITVTNAHITLVSRPAFIRLDGNVGCDLTVDRKGGVAFYERCTNPAPLTLGLNVLSRLHLYFATRESVLYFSAAAATK